MSSQPDAPPSGRSRFLSIEYLGELFLLAFTGFVFFYMLYESLDWQPGAYLLPRMVIIGGLPFWFWRVAMMFLPLSKGGGGKIMDTGFLESDDPPSVVARRWLRVTLTTGGLLGGVWIIGFHVAVPLYVFLYLVVYAHLKWYWAIIPGIFYESIMYFIYGKILLATWNEPLVVQIFNAVTGD